MGSDEIEHWTVWWLNFEGIVGTPIDRPSSINDLPCTKSSSPAVSVSTQSIAHYAFLTVRPVLMLGPARQESKPWYSLIASVTAYPSVLRMMQLYLNVPRGPEALAARSSPMDHKSFQLYLKVLKVG